MSWETDLQPRAAAWAGTSEITAEGILGASLAEQIWRKFRFWEDVLRSRRTLQETILGKFQRLCTHRSSEILRAAKPFIAMWAMNPFFGDCESCMTAQSPDCRRKALGWSHEEPARTQIVNPRVNLNPVFGTTQLWTSRKTFLGSAACDRPVVAVQNDNESTQRFALIAQPFLLPAL